MSNIAKKSSTAIAKRSSALDKIRSAKLPAAAQTAVAERTERRPRLVFAVDATASRAATWESAKKITDRMFSSIPGALDVSLAVHGGDRLHTFTEFSPNAQAFRDQAASVQCIAGNTRLCEIMERTLDAGGVKVFSYIGDAFEESSSRALALADRFKARGIKAVFLADQATPMALEIFTAIAQRTGGAVLDFRASQLDVMGEVLSAVAALAVGGKKLLEARQTVGAKLLLGHLTE